MSRLLPILAASALIAFVVSTGQTATLLDLSKIPLNRPVRVTLTDGTFQDGMVSRVTTEFLNLSQKPGLCEDVDVSRVASVSTIKKSGLPQHDKFSPATIVVLVPIALPFLVAFETKHLFEERYSPGQSGKISQQVIPFQISCNTLTTGLPGQVFALRATAQKRKAVERPIVGEWWKTSNRPNQEMWQFQSDGSFRTTAELPPRIGSYK